MGVGQDWDGVLTHEIWTASVTVYWEDLGLNINNTNRLEDRIRLEDGWSNLIKWLDENCRYRYNPHEAGIWFSDRQDAMLFKLTWAYKL